MDRWNAILLLLVMLSYLFLLLGFYELLKQEEKKEEEKKNYVLRLEYEYLGITDVNFVSYSLTVKEDGTIIKSTTIGLETIRKVSKLSKDELEELSNITIKSLNAREKYGCEEECDEITKIFVRVKLAENEVITKKIEICCGEEPEELKELLDYIERVLKEKEYK